MFRIIIVVALTALAPFAARFVQLEVQPCLPNPNPIDCNPPGSWPYVHLSTIAVALAGTLWVMWARHRDR